MKYIKNMLALLLAASCLLTAASCGKGDSNNTDHTAEPTDSADAVSATVATTEPEQLLSLVESGKSAFKIIYPEGASAELMSAISELVTDIRSYTGATLFYNDDFTRETQEELSAEYEILLGATNRAESEKQLGSLGHGEYVVAVEGNKLILGGHTDASTILAIRYFTTNFIYKNESLTKGAKDGTLVLSSADNYTFTRSYSIQEMTVDGVPISEFCFVTPEEGYAERYIADLLVKEISTFHGKRLSVLTESEAGGKSHVIRIGKTAGTTLTAKTGEYAISVTGGNIEIVSDSVFGYAEAYYAMCDEVLKPASKKVTLTTGQNWSGADAAPTEINSRGDIRIMYHNIWGYLNTDGSNPVSMRADIAIPIYEAIAPEILCFEEAGSTYRASARDLFNWLKDAGYGEICFGSEGGTGNPIFYRKDLLELVDSGYAKARSGDKGTTWAIFRLKSDTTKVFAVTNSHFAANSNAGGDATLGNTYRVQDATAAAEAVTAILAKYPSIPVFTGGDFNTSPAGDPYRVLTDIGLTNVMQLTDNKSTVKPFHGSYEYDNNFGLFDFATPAVAGSSSSSIDHIMTIPNGATVLKYFVMTDPISTTISDHCPQFVDVVLPK